MSVNPDGMDTVDYSDFEYQQTYFDALLDDTETTDSNASFVVNQEVAPLEGQGGLDQNEVAELVYAEAQIQIRHNQNVDDQDVGSETQLRGVYGANLPNSDDVIPGEGTGLNQTIVNTNNISDAGVLSFGSNDSEGRIFLPFRMNKSPAFDDQTNGPGGAGNVDTLVIQRPFRQMVGRGPVLDASDDLNAVYQLNRDDELLDITAQVGVHQIWDTAEVSDAGRAFSVPK